VKFHRAISMLFAIALLGPVLPAQAESLGEAVRINTLRYPAELGRTIIVSEVQDEDGNAVERKIKIQKRVEGKWKTIKKAVGIVTVEVWPGRYRAKSGTLIDGINLKNAKTADRPRARQLNPGCATRGEFRRVKIGMSLPRVKKIVGSRGQVTVASSVLTVRQWSTCDNPYGSMAIGFQKGRVQSKTYAA
jgi:hypothetical protein